MEYRLEVGTPLDTLGAIELTSIARGYSVVDRMLKKAPITVHDARAYCPGKFFIVVSGDVASVEEAIAIGAEEAKGALFGTLLIPNLSPTVIPAINRVVQPTPGETIGVIESFSAVSIVDAADTAVKSADVAIESINLLQGIGGKAYALFSGELTDVTAAVEAAEGRIPTDMFVESQVISQISAEVIPFLPGRS